MVFIHWIVLFWSNVPVSFEIIGNMADLQYLKIKGMIKEASSLDQINMTEFCLDYDQKIFTPTNLNIRA